MPTDYGYIDHRDQYITYCEIGNDPIPDDSPLLPYQHLFDQTHRYRGKPLFNSENLTLTYNFIKTTCQGHWTFRSDQPIYLGEAIKDIGSGFYFLRENFQPSQAIQSWFLEDLNVECQLAQQMFVWIHLYLHYGQDYIDSIYGCFFFYHSVKISGDGLTFFYLKSETQYYRPGQLVQHRLQISQLPVGTFCYLRGLAGFLHRPPRKDYAYQGENLIYLGKNQDNELTFLAFLRYCYEDDWLGGYYQIVTWSEVISALQERGQQELTDLPKNRTVTFYWQNQPIHLKYHQVVGVFKTWQAFLPHQW